MISISMTYAKASQIVDCMNFPNFYIIFKWKNTHEFLGFFASIKFLEPLSDEI